MKPRLHVSCKGHEYLCDALEVNLDDTVVLDNPFEIETEDESEVSFPLKDLFDVTIKES